MKDFLLVLYVSGLLIAVSITVGIALGLAARAFAWAAGL